jgi:hypothetical protein
MKPNIPEPSCVRLDERDVIYDTPPDNTPTLRPPPMPPTSPPPRKSWGERLKEAQAVIAICVGICTAAGGVIVTGVRWTVREVIRAELAEVRAKAETAASMAAAVPQMRRDLDVAHEEQVKVHARIDAELSRLSSVDMSLSEYDRTIQQRIDGLLTRLPR